MDVYSAILIMAMLAAGIAAASLSAASVLDRKDKESGRFIRAVQISGALSVFLALFGLIAHFETGHRPGMPAAMGLAKFLWAHPAPLATIVVGGACSWLAKRRSRKREANRDGLNSEQSF